nr:hypothetical protein CFP56_24331 [Quercus suber]
MHACHPLGMTRASDGDGVHLDLLQGRLSASVGMQHIIGAKDRTADTLLLLCVRSDRAMHVPQCGQQHIVREERPQHSLEPGGVGGGVDVEQVEGGLQGKGAAEAELGKGGGQQRDADGTGGDGGGLVVSDQLQQGGVGELVVLDLVDQARKVRVRKSRSGVGGHDRSRGPRRDPVIYRLGQIRLER